MKDTWIKIEVLNMTEEEDFYQTFTLGISSSSNLNLETMISLLSRTSETLKESLMAASMENTPAE